MPESFILIPGRTSRQGTALNEGKYTDEYLDEIGTMQVNSSDMQRMSLVEGDRVRVWSDLGEIIVPIKAAKGDELPAGLLFISYGMKSCELMGGETHGTGMPDSKGMDVFMEKHSG
ncbi:MAG: formylmethanofuran dehydrogenase [Planctomycetota bacterium]|nr:MAG: formylmethanofuran dehydrogenase [Planctomycetota bacterium]